MAELLKVLVEIAVVINGMRVNSALFLALFEDLSLILGAQINQLI